MRIMKQLIVGTACAALVFTAPACGDDTEDASTATADDTTADDTTGDEPPVDDTTGDDTTGDDTTGDDTTGDDTTGDDTTGDDTTGDDTAAADGACTNEADQAIMGTEEGYDAAVAVATSAAIACLTDADIATCVATQVVDETGLSTACSGCFVEQVMCSVQQCIAVCAPPNEASQACTDCRTENCIPLWEPCSGVAPSTGE